MPSHSRQRWNKQETEAWKERMKVQERISEILNAEAAAIAAIPVGPEFERAIDALKDCSGNVLTTGMGKAGHIARKFAATLCSTGTTAIYVHPGEAAHGDLGVVSENDCIVAFSTSGKTPKARLRVS